MKALTPFLVLIACTSVCYLCCALYWWDVNPGNWSSDGRGVLGVIIGAINVLSTIAAHKIRLEETDKGGKKG